MDNRTQKRKDFVARIQVEWTDENQANVSLNGMVEDRSEGGLLFVARRAVGAGVLLRISLGSEKLKGVVRWCKHTPAGYQIGVQFTTSEKAGGIGENAEKQA